MVGDFLLAQGLTPGPAYELADMLKRRYSWHVTTTSSFRTPVFRLCDMVSTVLFKRSQYDVVHVDVFSGRAFVWAEVVTVLLSVLKKPIVLTLRGGNLGQFAEAHPGRLKRVISRATIVTSPSKFLKTEFERRGCQVTLISNCIPVRNYPFRLRATPRPALLWLRSFHATYNPCLATRVLAELMREFPDASLTMCGPDKGDGSLNETSELATELGVAARVRFPGKISKDEIPKMGDTHDIFLNTTNVDNTPISVIEAMAMGMCVVSTNVGGIPYLLEHENDALLVPPNDVEAMASACRRILTDPELAQRLSSNARQKAECYDWDAVLPQWDRLFRSAAGVKNDERGLARNSPA